MIADLRPLEDHGHVDVADLDPCSARSRPRARSRSMLDASFQRGSVSGKWRPMSPGRRRRESRRSRRGRRRRRRSDRARRARTGSYAAQNQRPARDEPMQVVAGAGAAGHASAWRLALRTERAMAAAIARSSGVVILMFAASPSTIRTAWPACSASAASSVASAARQRERVAPARRGGTPAASARGKSSRARSVSATRIEAARSAATPADLLDRIARLDRGERRAASAAAAIVLAIKSALANGRAAS